ncbi:MAG TPA: hypothetical protein VEK06_01230, partial [Myxococcota bacterium]|nr:hypothetical protein [Myxococcota bacterium]
MKKEISVLLTIFLVWGMAVCALAQPPAEAPENEEQIKKPAMEQEEIKGKAAEEALERDMNAIRESRADTTEYTISPGSVELLVEMDPQNFGFRKRNHRMTITAE